MAKRRTGNTKEVIEVFDNAKPTATMNPIGNSKLRWSSLPQDLIVSIADHFNSRDDILSFRLVCQSFRSSIPFLPPKYPSPYTPLRIPLLITEIPYDGDYLLLTQSHFYSVEPINISNILNTKKPWLVKLEELNSGQIRVKDLSSRCDIPNCPYKLLKSSNLNDYGFKRISETQAYGLVSVVAAADGAEEIETEIKAVMKVVLSTSLDEIDDKSTIMVAAIHDKGKLSVWRNGDKEWTNIIIDNLNTCFFGDCVYHNEKFYVLERSGYTMTVDSTLKKTQVTGPLWYGGYRHLLKSRKDLFLIDHTYWFEDNYEIVFLLDDEIGWIHVIDELEDRVWVVSDDCSFSVKELSGCKGNDIYYHTPRRPSDFRVISKIILPPVQPDWLDN